MAGMLTEPSEIDLTQCRKLPKVAAILDFNGIADVNELLAGPHVRSWANRWIGEGPNREEFARKMSPVSYVRGGDPATFIVHGDADSTVPYAQSVRLQQALEQAEVPAQLYTVSGGLHGKFDEEQMRDVFNSIHQFLVDSISYRTRMTV